MDKEKEGHKEKGGYKGKRGKEKTVNPYAELERVSSQIAVTEASMAILWRPLDIAIQRLNQLPNEIDDDTSLFIGLLSDKDLTDKILIHMCFEQQKLMLVDTLSDQEASFSKLVENSSQVLPKHRDLLAKTGKHLEGLSMDVPFDSLPEGSPTMSEIAKMPLPLSDSDMGLLDNIFISQHNVDHIETLVFLTALGIKHPESPAFLKKDRELFLNKGVTREALAFIDEIRLRINDYFYTYYKELLSEPLSESLRVEREDLLPADLLLSAALVEFTLAKTERKLFPSDFEELLSYNFVPNLNTHQKEKFSQRFKNKFVKYSPNFIYNTDQIGQRPYESVIRSYETGEAKEYLEELATIYPESSQLEGSEDPLGIIADNYGDIVRYLGKSIQTIEGDMGEGVALIDLSPSHDETMLHIMVFSPDGKSLKFSVDGKNRLGTPKGYKGKSGGAVKHVLDQVVSYFRSKNVIDHVEAPAVPETIVVFQSPQTEPAEEVPAQVESKERVLKRKAQRRLSGLTSSQSESVEIPQVSEQIAKEPKLHIIIPTDMQEVLNGYQEVVREAILKELEFLSMHGIAEANKLKRGFVKKLGRVDHEKRCRIAIEKGVLGRYNVSIYIDDKDSTKAVVKKIGKRGDFYKYKDY